MKNVPHTRPPPREYCSLGSQMWKIPDILLTIFGVILMVSPLALWIAWTNAIFIGVLVAALVSLIGAVIITRSQG